MTMIKGLFLAALVSVAAPVLAVDTYRVDQSHSSVQFSVRHMLLSNTRGTFGDFAGEIKWDADPQNSSISGTVKVASIDTRDGKRDDHLRSADFFDTTQFSEMSFKSKSIKKSKKIYTVTGDLTIKGVTRPVTFPLEVSNPIKDPWGNQRVNFSTQFKINRQDFGITWNKTMDNGGVVVGNDVNVELDVEGVKVQ
jgi:polyisoprenoid-binding protein YceI